MPLSHRLLSLSVFQCLLHNRAVSGHTARAVVVAPVAACDTHLSHCRLRSPHHRHTSSCTGHCHAHPEQAASLQSKLAAAAYNSVPNARVREVTSFGELVRRTGTICVSMEDSASHEDCVLAVGLVLPVCSSQGPRSTTDTGQGAAAAVRRVWLECGRERTALRLQQHFQQTTTRCCCTTLYATVWAIRIGSST